MYGNFQEKRLAQEIDDIEKDTGFKLRVLAQNYPDTPGVPNILYDFGIQSVFFYFFKFLYICLGFCKQMLSCHTV